MELLPRVVVVCSLLHALCLVVGGSSSVATNKLSPASWGSYSRTQHKGPGTYAFGYDIEDPLTGNVQFRREEKHPNGTVTGLYGHVDAEGVPRLTRYVSDGDGHRVEQESVRELPLPPKPSHPREPARGGHGNFIQNPAPIIYQLNDDDDDHVRYPYVRAP